MHDELKAKSGLGHYHNFAVFRFPFWLRAPGSDVIGLRIACYHHPSHPLPSSSSWFLSRLSLALPSEPCRPPPGSPPNSSTVQSRKSPTSPTNGLTPLKTSIEETKPPYPSPPRPTWSWS